MARRSDAKPTINLKLKPGNIRQSMSDVVFETLREAILSRELPGGTALIEAQLSEQFEVSKTPVREALQRLTHIGLVDNMLAKGATVHMLSPDEIQDIFELRMVLEPMALSQSAPLLTPAEIAEIAEVLEQAQQEIQAQNHQELSRLNSVYHGSLVQHAHNQMLSGWLDTLSDRRRLISMQGWALLDRSETELDEHRSILEAIRQQNFQLAVERLKHHIQRFSEIVLENPTTSDDGASE